VSCGDRPEDVQAFVAAWLEAQAFWQANPEAGNQLIADATGQKPEDISLKGIALRTLGDNQKSLCRWHRYHLSLLQCQLNLNFLIQTGNITKAARYHRAVGPGLFEINDYHCSPPSSAPCALEQILWTLSDPKPTPHPQ